MNDQEFDVLDELYFVTGFEELKNKTGLDGEELKSTLSSLLDKNWIKCLLSMDEDAPEDYKQFDKEYKRYFYLATKAGLLAHNGM